PGTGEIKIEPATMKAPRRNHAAILIPGNNTVLIAGGTAAGHPLSQTEIYIPWRRQFRSSGDLEMAKTAAVAGPLKPLGALLIAGGRNPAGTQSNSETLAAPTIVTDKPDYHPGEHVTISGSGWIPGQPVRIAMQESPDIDQPAAINTVADAGGNISDSSFSP